MLSTMEDPQTIGPSMAVALLTTLYGAMIANLVALPIADKLASKAQAENLIRTLVIEGTLHIQNRPCRHRPHRAGQCPGPAQQADLDHAAARSIRSEG
jgi:flagellar motor component MotA